jgi:hypothetical protein
MPEDYLTDVQRLNLVVEYLDCLRDAVLSLYLIAESLGSASHRRVGETTTGSP